MNVGRYIVSLAKVSKPLRIKSLEEDVITALKIHQNNKGSQKGKLTVYCSKINPYNSMYCGSKLKDDYKKQVKEQITIVLRAFGISDNTYEIDVRYHPNAVR